jgi:para-nitrobenzyl esterase
MLHSHRRLLTVTARFALAIALTIVPALGLATNQPAVVTSDGPVQGFHRDGVTQFRGIPYAAPPVGPLRWRPPQAAAKWTAVLDAVNFGDTCVQNQPGLFARPSLTENCLYLNVYTPDAFQTTIERRPVMVWFYGGGLTAGESDDYDGTKLVKQGDTVVVTVNFRGGYLGYFALAALDAEGHDFGNYGLMDQQFALRWIQRNIVKFGGDPKRVTIFGQSGGATAVMTNLVSPRSAGLFQRLINESGTHITAIPLAQAEVRGQALAVKAGCGDAADVMKCMRALTPLQILSLGAPPASYFVIDGKLITGDAFEQYRTGAFNHVPIMTGLVEDEQSFFLPEIAGGPPVPLTASEFDDYVNTYGAANAPAIHAAYPLSSYASPSLAEVAVAQGNKACIARQFDRWWSQSVPVYAYQFMDETAPSYFPPVSYPTRAFHTSEIMYIFPLFRGGQGTAHPLNAAQERLSDQMVAYWTSFARTGNPNNALAPRWDPYSAQRDDVIALIEPKPHMTVNYGAQTYHSGTMKNDCTLWDPIPLTGGRS